MKGRPRFTVVVLLISTFALFMVRIYIANEIEGLSPEYGALRRELASLQAENQALYAEVLHYSSYESIEERAEELGFHKAPETIVIPYAGNR